MPLVLRDEKKEVLFPIADREPTADGLRLETLEGTVVLIPYSDFVAGRFSVTEYSGSEQLFQVDLDQGHTVMLRNVPIFRCYKDAKGRPDVDVKYLDEMVRNFNDWKNSGWLPKIHISHTSKGGGDENEKPVIGFVDNLHRDRDTLYCDFRQIDTNLFDYDLAKGRYPDRSIELDSKNKRLISVALLGASMPFHPLPQMRGLKRSFERAKEMVAQYSIDHAHLVLKYEDAEMHKFARVAFDYLSVQPGVTLKFTETDLSQALITTYKGDDVDELFDALKKMLKAKRAAEINKTGPQNAGTGYSLTVEDLKQYACGFGTMVSADTGLFGSDGRTGAGEAGTGVNDKGEPTNAEPHFNSNVDITKFVSTLPEGARELFVQQNEMLTKFAGVIKNMQTTMDELREKSRLSAEEAETTRFKALLTEIRAGGVVGITEDTIPMHLDIFKSYKGDEEKIKRYASFLRAQAAVRVGGSSPRPGERVRLRDDSVADPQKYRQEVKNNEHLRSDLRRLGFSGKDAEDFHAIVSRYADLDVEHLNGQLEEAQS